MVNMSKEDIETLLKNEVSIILNLPKEEIIADMPLHDMGFDSLSFVELLVAIEKKCNIMLIETNLNKNDFRSIEALSSRIYEVRNSE
jgi:acyl carrier protein